MPCGPACPSRPFCHRIQNREVLRMLAHHLAAERERVLPGGMREFVDEAFEIDRVLVVVHAAPEPRRDMRIAHRIVDQHVRDIIAELAFRAAGVQTLEGDRVRSALHRLRTRISQDRLPGKPHMQTDQVVVLVEGAGQLALSHRMINAVGHVLFARLDHLDRHARHLLGDVDRLGHIFAARAPSEAGAEHQTMDHALVGWQTGCRDRGCQRRLAILRRGPHLALFRRVARRGVHRLKYRRGSGRDSSTPPRPSWQHSPAPA